MRTLYLQRYASVNGEHSLIGQKLFDQFSSISEECLLGHIVLSDEDAAKIIDARLKNGIVSESMLQELAPDLIYLEGGLFQDSSGA